MRLWLLRPIEEDDDRWFYDAAQGFVVRAGCEAEARELVAHGRIYDIDVPDGRPLVGQEGPESWHDPAVTSCVPLEHEGQPGVLMRDYLHS